MIEYKCNKCNKTFNKKSNFDTHSNRKYSCIVNIQNDPKNSQIEPKNSQNIAKIDKTNKLNKLDKTDEKIQCNYCKKIFTLKSSLNKHLNNRCKIKKEDTNKKEEIYQSLIKQMDENRKLINELKEENKQLKKEIANKNIINNINNGTMNNIDKQQNINTNNQQNNIKNLNINLIAHGKEDLSFITEEQFKKILYKGFKSIENLTEMVHFDKNRPENHNIYISNIKDSYVMKYDGDDWKLINRENCLQDIYEDKSDYLVEKFEELHGKLDEQTTKRFGNFLNRKDDDKIIEQTKKEIKLILYNNRKIPEETRRLLRLTDEPNELISNN